MNLFNRFWVIFTLLLIAAVTILVMAIPDQFFLWLAEAFGAFEPTLLTKLIILAGGGAIIALCLLGLVLELRGEGGQEGVVVHTAAGERVELAAEAIAQRLKGELESLAEVRQVKPQVRGMGQKVAVNILVETGPEVNVPAKAQELTQAARLCLEEKMGLRLAKLRIRITHQPSPSGQGG